ncbi:MAG: sensor histidine kinase, partial [Spirochaetaceae bacterium]
DAERREAELAERVAVRTAELERALDSQRTLLAELHHRTKNNLQLVSSILSYEGETLASDADEQRVEAAQDRIRALARLHDLLYASTPTDKTDLGYFLDRFIQELTGLVGHRGLTINPAITVDRTVPVDTAIRVALMINEIVLNTLEHAHADGHGCSVDIAVTDDDTHISVVASDNGPGIVADVETRRGLGVELIGLLAKGLGGTAEHDGTAGVRWEISVPR